MSCSHTLTELLHLLSLYFSIAQAVKYMQVGAVQSPVFTNAFFSMYLGEQPVSQDGKQSIANGLAHIIAAEQ